VPGNYQKTKGKERNNVVCRHQALASSSNLWSVHYFQRVDHISCAMKLGKCLAYYAFTSSTFYAYFFLPMLNICLLNNIYVVLFIKGKIVLSVWPIYTLFVFRLTQSIHNKQIIQNRSLLFVFDLNCFNMVSELVLWNEA